MPLQHVWFYTISGPFDWTVASLLQDLYIAMQKFQPTYTATKMMRVSFTPWEWHIARGNPEILWKHICCINLKSWRWRKKERERERVSESESESESERKRERLIIMMDRNGYKLMQFVLIGWTTGGETSYEDPCGCAFFVPLVLLSSCWGETGHLGAGRSDHEGWRSDQREVLAGPEPWRGAWWGWFSTQTLNMSKPFETKVTI